MGKMYNLFPFTHKDFPSVVFLFQLPEKPYILYALACIYLLAGFSAARKQFCTLTLLCHRCIPIPGTLSNSYLASPI